MAIEPGEIRFEGCDDSPEEGTAAASEVVRKCEYSPNNDSPGRLVSACQSLSRSTTTGQ